MSVRRVVPNIVTGTGDGTGDASAAMRANAAFYGLLGLDEVMNQGWIMTLASPSHPTAQVSIMTADRTGPVTPDLSVEVEDVDAVYAAVVRSGAEIVYGPADEEWGVRRFFVRDPNGRVINVLSHG
ncbi:MULTISPECIES: VOC family protein [Streptomyces]|uniref:VOC family protein n=1 Tax=Streptomyces poriferorum TaxID=2798799 RepID=A0ABY9IWY7_9ACTN|nr:MULTISPECIES: VOC family protein [Streptomyces]MBW5249429.1 VOC family protein [Streptomyces poriferorum]MBW5257675.1 VOC family protein [Streptomyces poriferorum]MDP5311596.1 VOC family protein [Streptomyces sp. Alt4]WLQ59314.1 VOC family protein [Streptomyces sp. Alt2]WSI62818.1 VOC family protein [Streptomyces sp. NBC_01336]